MTQKELFEIALKYKLKGYNTEHLRYGDDLYNATKEQIETCIEMFCEIDDNGIKWAYEKLKML